MNFGLLLTDPDLHDLIDDAVDDADDDAKDDVVVEEMEEREEFASKHSCMRAYGLLSPDGSIGCRELKSSCYSRLVDFLLYLKR